MKNLGSEALDRALTADGHGSAADLARRLCVTPSMVTNWRSGRRVPVTRYRLMLANDRKTGIAIALWDQPSETTEGTNG